MLNDLRSRKIPGLLAHQADVLREYTETALEESDVAFELPTGSGKTLVGILLGEWRRRKFRERVVYLCPTNQLVNQVVEQATSKYGVKVNGFTGKKKDYDSAITSEYLNCEAIAITSYSALFNTNPFFANPHIIILDDAHSAENYIASQWSIRITRNDSKTLYLALVTALKGVLPPTDYQKLIDGDSSAWDSNWVDKIPTPLINPLIPELVSIIDVHVADSDLRYSWGLLRTHLDACHVYIGTRELLIRPLLPPTHTHSPFVNAKQRIYMSATLGEGGELERLTARQKNQTIKGI